MSLNVNRLQSLTNFNSGDLINDFIPRGSMLYNFDPFVSGYVYMFMTTPMLNLSASNLISLDIDQSVISSRIMDQLSYGISESKHRTNSKFIKIVSNLAKGFPLDDFSLDTINSFKSQTGFEFSYGGNISNENLQDINITFQETKDLDITKMMFLWTKYISYAKYGSVVRDPKIAERRILDYSSAIYFFVTEPDGETLALWGRYTGVFPTSVPLSGLGTETKAHSINEISVSFKSNFREIYSRHILSDFSTLISGNEVIPIGKIPSSSQRDQFINRDTFVAASNNNTEAFYRSQQNQISVGNDSETLDRNEHFLVSSSPIIVRHDDITGTKYKLRFVRKGFE